MKSIPYSKYIAPCTCLRKVKQFWRRGCDGIEIGRVCKAIDRANEWEQEAADQAGVGLALPLTF